MSAPYSRETIDAKFDAFRHEFRADLNALEGRLMTAIEGIRGDFRAEVASLRGEWKVWIIVMGTILGVLSSGVGNRLLNLVWPSGPQPPAAVVPFIR